MPLLINLSLMFESSYQYFPVRASTVLTNAAVAGTVLGLSPTQLTTNNQLIIYADFTIGSLTNVILTVEFSPDNTNWYAETYPDTAVATGVTTERIKTHVIAATGLKRLTPIVICDRYIRISATGTGTVTSSLLKVDAVIGNI